MNISILKEIKPQEGRVALLPKHVKVLVDNGHSVFVESSAGALSRAYDEEYVKAGAKVMPDAKSTWEAGQFIVKVKEILPPEYEFLRADHIILTNIHAALNEEETNELLKVGCTGISAENTHAFGSPNCALAGEVGAFEGVRLSFAQQGGVGRHFMAHFGEEALKCMVIGLGNVGRGVMRTLFGLGAQVIALDSYEGARKAARMDYYDKHIVVDDVENISEYVYDVDVVYNCVLWDKNRNDHLISREMMKKMRKGVVIVDISCDTAGAIETSRSTTWAEPTYVEEGVVHFAVDNIPGAVPVTASAGYGEALLPHILELTSKGVKQACKDNPFLARGLTCVNGELILEEAGKYQNREFTPVKEWLDR